MKLCQRDFLLVIDDVGRILGIVRDIEVFRAIAERKKKSSAPLVVGCFMLSPVFVIEHSAEPHTLNLREEFDKRSEVKALVLTKEGKVQKVLFREAPDEAHHKVRKRAS